MFSITHSKHCQRFPSASASIFCCIVNKTNKPSCSNLISDFEDKPLWGAKQGLQAITKIMHEWEWRCRKPFQSIFWSCLCPTEATRFQRPWASLERVVKRRFFDAATWPCLCQLLQSWHPFASPYPTYPLDWRGQSGAEGDRFSLIIYQVVMGLFPGAAKGGASRMDRAPKSLLWPPNAGLSSAKGWRTSKMGSCATTQLVWQYSQYSHEGQKREARGGETLPHLTRTASNCSCVEPKNSVKNALVFNMFGSFCL